MFVRNDAIENCLFNLGFKHSNKFAGLQAADLHDFFAPHRRLKRAQTVLFFHFYHLRMNTIVVRSILFDQLRIFRGNICPAEDHQVINQLSRVKQEPADCRIGHILIDKRHRTEMKAYELFDVRNLFERKFQLPEHVLHHPGAKIFVTVERPADSFAKLLRPRFSDVVDESREPKVDIVRDL